MKKIFAFFVFLMAFSQIFAQQRVIVVMNEKFDDAKQGDFDINVRKAFCQASQQEVIDFLNSFKDEVSEIKQFWTFNGFSCVVSEEIMAQLAERQDVAYVYRDEKRKMVPDFVETSAVETRDKIGRAHV